MLAAIHHQNLAQGRALQALRAEHSDVRLGTVINLQPARPSSDQRGRSRRRRASTPFWNGAFLDPLFKGILSRRRSPTTSRR